jgi:hypothetical protein
MKSEITLSGHAGDVCIRGGVWFMLGLDKTGLYLYDSVGLDGVDTDGERWRLKIIGVDCYAY